MYIRAGIYPIEETMARFLDIDEVALREKYGRMWRKGIEKEIISLDGYRVKIHSQRYQLFKKKGITCVACGMVGKFFALESTQDNIDTAKRLDREPTYHFNLYGIDDHGSEVLMTKDHIIPASRGGKNIMSNLQVMCTLCNVEKTSKLPPEFRPIQCCADMKNHGDALMNILNVESGLTPFQFCPWCTKKLRYVERKSWILNDGSVMIPKNEMEEVA